MKIIVKTIKGETFEIECEPQTNIEEVKQKIFQVKGIDVDTQKLIVKGSNTTNNQTIEGLGLKEGDFLVIMTVKKPAQAAPQEQQPAGGVPQQPQSIFPAQPPPQQVPQPAPAQPKPTAINQQVVDEIVSMGFPKEHAIAALKAAKGNADLAMEILFNGGVVGGQGGPQGPPGAGGAGGPSITQERLAEIIQHIQATEPEMAELLKNDPEALTQYLMANGLLGGGPGMGEGQPQVGFRQNTGPLTAADNQAIERLCSFGFDKNIVTEAYKVCDRDENLTANYLLEMGPQALPQQAAPAQPPQQPPSGGQQQPPKPDDDNIFQ